MSDSSRSRVARALVNNSFGSSAPPSIGEVGIPAPQVSDQELERRLMARYAPAAGPAPLPAAGVIDPRKFVPEQAPTAVEPAREMPYGGLGVAGNDGSGAAMDAAVNPLSDEQKRLLMGRELMKTYLPGASWN